MYDFLGFPGNQY
jgi:hypothetical protein